MNLVSYLTPSVASISSLDESIASLWISCHGYESRSTAHLELAGGGAARRVSYGFDFPGPNASEDVVIRIEKARKRLTAAGFSVHPTDDTGFEAMVRAELASLHHEKRPRIVADVSSMSRSRIAALILACADSGFEFGCDLDIVYFPGSHASHKHAYEPLEYFGPCHREMAGWPDDPDLPLALIIGLGTEPRRADGIVEMLEPDILGLFTPVGDEPDYINDVRRVNRRLLEVGGEPIRYLIREPEETYARLLGTTRRLAERSRLIIVPLGPKVFCAISIAVALATGPEVGVWKASAGKGVTPVDVKAKGAPIFFRVGFS